MSDQSKLCKTLALRVSAEENQQIRASAFAGHLSVSEYLRRRTFDQPTLSYPMLAALAELMSTLARLEQRNADSEPLVEKIRAVVENLSVLCAQDAATI